MTDTFSARVRASSRKMAKICGHDARNGAILADAFDTIAEGWCGRTISDTAPFENDLSDDSSPYEFSISTRGAKADIRLLVEPQQTPYGLSANFSAGLAAHARLREKFAVDTVLFERVSRLFAPSPGSRSGATFALWHGIVVNPEGHLLVKAYLNPRIHGDAHGGALVLEALLTLGFDGAHAYLESILDRVDSVPYFSLDLCDPARARAKFYVSTRELARVEELSGGAEATERLTGYAGPYSARPILICASFRREDPQPELTLHVPVRSYARSDRETIARVRGLVDDRLLARFSACAEVLDERQHGRDIVSYVSLKVAEENAATLYLCPRLFAQHEQQREQKESPVRLARLSLAHMGEVHELIERRAKQLVEHPFLTRVGHSNDLSEFLTLLQRLGFFTLVFQDVLRLSRLACRDEAVLGMCRELERGDRGHDRWFMRDVQRLSVKLDLDVVFRSDYREARDLTYELLGLVTGCQDDHARLSVLLVLEAAAELFFERVPAFARRCGIAEPLEYFGDKHLAAEQAHAIHEHGSESPLIGISIPADSQTVVLNTVERAFGVMARLAGDLDLSMRGAQAA